MGQYERSLGNQGFRYLGWRAPLSRISEVRRIKNKLEAGAGLTEVESRALQRAEAEGLGGLRKTKTAE
jgi:hypothetical protein